MSTRTEKFNRLAIGSECHTSWDAMQGNDRRRFCAECQRDVLDFERLTPREISAHLEASHGRLCARLTRTGGRLSVFEPVEPLDPLRPSTPRRASSVAAALLAAGLGFGVGSAQTDPGAPTAGIGTRPSQPDEDFLEATPDAKVSADSALTGALTGKITDENGEPLAGAEIVVRNAKDQRQYTAITRKNGDFRLAALPTGIYDLVAKLDGFQTIAVNDVILDSGRVKRLNIETQVDPEFITLGDVRINPEALRKVFAESDLVLAAVAGPSRILEIKGSLAEVATELKIESLIRGRVSERSVTYGHAVYLNQDGTPSNDLKPGTRVLAFLDRAQEVGSQGEPTYESLDHGFGIKKLDDTERAAYLQRLGALVNLEAQFGRREDVDSVALMEWLVGTAESPQTQKEAIGEIQDAVEALRKFAEREGTTFGVATSNLRAAADRFGIEGDRPALLAASLTGGQKKRLETILHTTKGLDGEALPLFGIVRAWNPDVATTWLVLQLRTTEPDYGYEQWRLFNLATTLGDPNLIALSDAAIVQARGIETLWPDDRTAQTAELRHENLVELTTKLRQDFVEGLLRLR
ncbi:MAG: carboxypeptidase-like regulatory domain-containing protein [Acidobacteriota bacterium]